MNKKLCRLWLLLAALCLTSCARKSGPVSFSSVSEGGFRPETSFIERGYSLKHASNQGVSNPATFVQWHSWQGLVTIPGVTNCCEAVAITIRDALNKSLGDVCRDELTSTSNPIGKRGQLLYLKDGMRGEVHVWLFGAPTEAEVSYAILLREERANSSSANPAPRWKFWKAN
jgi:hypothetical protein